MFNFSFLQSLPLTVKNSFNVKLNGNIAWKLCWRLETRYRKLFIFASPYESVIRPDVDWSVEVDITGKVGSTSFTKNNVKLNSEAKKGMQFNYGETIFEWDEQTFLKAQKTPEKTVLVTVEVSNIRMTGLRKFLAIDFEKSGSGCSDLIIILAGKTIHSHSQILSFSSTVFRGKIKKLTPPYVIHLKSFIVYEDFLELLHHIYHPAEVIDEHNLRTILPLATKFEATQTLEICQRFLKKCLLKHTVDKDSKIEYFFLAWKNDVKPLKTDCIKVLFPWDELSLTELRHKQLYQNLDENQKLELLECLIMISKPVSAHSNKLAWWNFSTVLF